MGRWGAGVCFDTLILQPSLALCGDLSWEGWGERWKEREREREKEGGIRGSRLKKGGCGAWGLREGEREGNDGKGE